MVGLAPQGRGAETEWEDKGRSSLLGHLPGEDSGHIYAVCPRVTRAGRISVGGETRFQPLNPEGLVGLWRPLAFQFSYSRICDFE